MELQCNPSIALVLAPLGECWVKAGACVLRSIRHSSGVIGQIHLDWHFGSDSTSESTTPLTMKTLTYTNSSVRFEAQELRARRVEEPRTGRRVTISQKRRAFTEKHQTANERTNKT
mmetsp:Transcript_40138/g.62692  ORF Transcript_40138/g.62692 Transcript_40138/m.62692 type:complete len:116 (-) Transcript_40138:139-486(-)